MPKIKCKTNTENDWGGPEHLSVVPRVGEYIENKYGKQLRVLKVIHKNDYESSMFKNYEDFKNWESEVILELG